MVTFSCLVSYFLFSPLCSFGIITFLLFLYSSPLPILSCIVSKGVECLMNSVLMYESAIRIYAIKRRLSPFVISFSVAIIRTKDLSNLVYMLWSECCARKVGHRSFTIPSFLAVAESFLFVYVCADGFRRFSLSFPCCILIYILSRFSLLQLILLF